VALGRITVLVGRPGEGKSFLTTDMAARVTTGSAWPDGGPGVDGSAILICAEDDPADTIRPRLDAQGADVRRVHLLSMVRRTAPDGRCCESMFSLADLAALEQALRTHRDCKLVVVDPIGSFLGGGTDSHRDSDVRAVLAPVAKLAETYGPAVLVVAHRRKSAGPAADDLTMGSRAFTGIARAVWHLTRDPDNKNRRLLLSGKNNLAAEGTGLAFTIGGTPATLSWEADPVAMTADEAVRQETADRSQDRSSSPRQQAVTWLENRLSQGPARVEDIETEAKAAGHAWRTVQRAREELGVRSYRNNDTGPKMWALCETAEEPLLAGV
jgi:RecA-family ATPase